MRYAANWVLEENGKKGIGAVAVPGLPVFFVGLEQK